MSKTYKLCATALLAAISVAANAFTVVIVGNAVSFTYLPCFIAAAYLGVIPATVVGFVGDLVAGYLFPKGAFNLLISLASTLMGIIPGLVYRFLPCSRQAKLTLSLVITFVVCSAGINTYAMWQYVSTNYATFWIYFAIRVPVQALNAAVNGVILALLQQSNALSKLFPSAQ